MTGCPPNWIRKISTKSRRYTGLAPTPLEQQERLEQLRVLEHGHDIAVAVAVAHFHGIDTPEQYEAFVRRQRG